MPRFVHRPSIMSRRGLVVAGNPTAAHVGADVLRSGGNAVDAAVAAAGVLAVAAPHMNGLGGDAFALIHSAATGRSYALNASGAAPRSADLRTYRERGLIDVPVRGPLSISVPGVVHGWLAALERFGHLSREVVLAPAILLARDGVPVDRHLCDFLNSSLFAELCAQRPELMSLYGAPGNRRVGELLAQPSLSATLSAVANEGVQAFYQGSIPTRICDAVQSAGGVLAVEDFSSHETLIQEPLEVPWGGASLVTCPPNTQGLVLSLILGLLEASGVPYDSPGFAPAMLRAKQIAFAQRDLLLRDPGCAPIPEDLFRVEQLKQEWQGTTFRSSRKPLSGSGDTTCVVTMDWEGNAVSLVQSLFEEMGSGIAVPDVGVVLQNRLSQANLSPTSPLALAPGMRPPHTLCPALVESGGLCRVVAATPGGHGQAQTLAQVLIEVWCRGADPQSAVEAPRFCHDDGSVALCESRLDSTWVRAMMDAGWQVNDVGPWARTLGIANSMGAATVISVTDDGLRMGGADPRRDSYAVAE